MVKAESQYIPSDAIHVASPPLLLDPLASEERLEETPVRDHQW